MNNIILAIIMISIIGCGGIKRESQSIKTDSCKNIPTSWWGQKGALTPEAFDLANCYDWIIQRK